MAICGWLKGIGKHLMQAVVADIAGAEQPTVGRLVLKIEGPVLRVGQLVVDVVAAKQERSEQIAAGIIAGFGLRRYWAAAAETPPRLPGGGGRRVVPNGAEMLARTRPKSATRKAAPA